MGAADCGPVFLPRRRALSRFSAIGLISAAMVDKMLRYSASTLCGAMVTLNFFVRRLIGGQLVIRSGRKPEQGILP